MAELGLEPRHLTLRLMDVTHPLGSLPPFLMLFFFGQTQTCQQVLKSAQLCHPAHRQGSSFPKVEGSLRHAPAFSPLFMKCRYFLPCVPASETVLSIESVGGCTEQAGAAE